MTKTQATDIRLLIRALRSAATILDEQATEEEIAEMDIYDPFIDAMNHDLMLAGALASRISAEFMVHGFTTDKAIGFDGLITEAA